jgi:hypothetical protein
MLGFSIHSNQYKFWRYWYPQPLTYKPVPIEGEGVGHIWRWLWFVWGPDGNRTLLSLAISLAIIGGFLLVMRVV